MSALPTSVALSFPFSSSTCLFPLVALLVPLVAGLLLPLAALLAPLAVGLLLPLAALLVPLTLAELPFAVLGLAFSFLALCVALLALLALAFLALCPHPVDFHGLWASSLVLCARPHAQGAAPRGVHRLVLQNPLPDLGVGGLAGEAQLDLALQGLPEPTHDRSDDQVLGVHLGAGHLIARDCLLELNELLM